MEWAEYFEYDESSPTFLRWRVERYGGADHNRILVVDVGDVAGCITVHGYGEVKLDGISYKVHRVIWEMFVGPLKEGEDIDHKDGKRVNNRLDNLRICNDQINSQNRIKRRDNTSGETGVNYYRNKEGKEYWLARWTDTSGKERAKSFRIDVTGNDEAFSAAVAHRKKMIQTLIEQGQYYTERHGK